MLIHQDAGLEGEVSRLQDRVKALERDVQRKEGVSKELRGRVGELQGINEGLQRKADAAREHKELSKKLKGDLERRDDAARGLKSKVEQLARELQEAKDALRGADAREAKVYKQLTARSGEWDVVYARCGALQEAVRKVLNQVMSDVEDLASDLGEAAEAERRLVEGHRVAERVLEDPVDPDQVH